VDLGLEGKGVVVTGGASNIGRAISLGFAAEGARVLIADVDEAQAERVAGEAPAGRISHRRTDVTDAGEVEATMAHAIETLGAVDVLVNCAGWTVDRLFLEKPREEWEREIAIDMWGFINATRAVLDHMIERGYGRIVSIGSDAGRIGEWREAVYSGTKASVIAMSKAIAKEVGRHGITLNVVCPGFTPGPPESSGEHSIWRAAQGEQFADEEILRKIARSYPLRRLGTPEDVVGPVLLLASDRASYVTGQTLSVSGGYTMI
jgi:2-hydroxycyclohexanecarboxyl-CoA dehydrogenase